MMTDAEWNSSEDDEYRDARAQTRKSKRRKVIQTRRAKAVAIKVEESTLPQWSLDPLLQALHEQTAQDWENEADRRDSFDEIIETLLPNLLQAGSAFFERDGQDDESSLRTSYFLPRFKVVQLHESNNAESPDSVLACIIHAKSRTHSRLFRRVILERTPSYMASGSLTPLRSSRTIPAVNPEVLDALYAIQTTPYESSFLSRLQGFNLHHQVNAIAVDWETRTPWMDLMTDIREHYSFAHPEREQASESVAPVIYSTLQRCHLDQVHDLLRRVFWEGIDVTDSLDYTPEKCTIVAMYKQLVVGAAFLSSPQETYITYLAVRAGWDNSQIATSMLYHLISLNPHKDITLHVSINNPAMLLYNRFGFKAEEFIVGFYEDYLDAKSPQSKNAFRLRLRRW